jgi:hypothetical protein
MQYKGKELVEFTSDKNVAFNPPKKMFVWDCEGYIYKRRVVAYLGGYHRDYKVIAFGPIDECKTLESYAHCSESSPTCTNWDVYCERYGIDKDWDFQKVTSVDLNCTTCPAWKICKKSKIYNKGKIGVNCPDPFIRWAKSEAEEEK